MREQHTFNDLLQSVLTDDYRVVAPPPLKGGKRRKLDVLSISDLFSGKFLTPSLQTDLTKSLHRRDEIQTAHLPPPPHHHLPTFPLHFLPLSSYLRFHFLPHLHRHQARLDSRIRSLSPRQLHSQRSSGTSFRLRESRERTDVDEGSGTSHEVGDEATEQIRTRRCRHGMNCFVYHCMQMED